MSTIIFFHVATIFNLPGPKAKWLLTQDVFLCALLGANNLAILKNIGLMCYH